MVKAFPQCANATLQYDISFTGKQLSLKAGTVTWAYRRFGPTNPKLPKQPPLVLIPGLGFSMYIWPVPMLQRMALDREVVMLDNMRT